jgi:hypothetical protein
MDTLFAYAKAGLQMLIVRMDSTILYLSGTCCVPARYVDLLNSRMEIPNNK